MWTSRARPSLPFRDVFRPHATRDRLRAERGAWAAWTTTPSDAVAERFIQTLKVELIWTRDWASLAELREAVAQWLHVYNHVRPHEALDWMTPAEKRAENLGIEINQAA